MISWRVYQQQGTLLLYFFGFLKIFCKMGLQFSSVVLISERFDAFLEKFLM